MPIEWAFWIAVLVLGYVYLGYPAIMVLLARLVPRPVDTGVATPTITVLIAAHNEERHIARKIENCLVLSYPPERLDILVVSDGSTDRTTAIAREYARRQPNRVRVVSIRVRQGKPNALNTGAALATGEILLLADVRQRFEPEVARALVRNFADPTVGAVSGELLLTDSHRVPSGQGVGLYWRYEKALRYAESRVRSAIHYTGAVTAIRRSVFTPLPKETLHDDVVMALRVAALGYRVIFEPAARAFDSTVTEPGREFARKVRTLAAALQTALHLRQFVGPLGVLLWWQFVSHTLLRLALPYALIVVLIGSALLAAPLYRGLLLAQCVVYSLGIVGLWAGHGRGRRMLSLPSTFLILNGAALVGPLLYLAGRRLDLWRIPVHVTSDA